LSGHWETVQGIKSASTQLINDALEYFNAINDNTVTGRHNRLETICQGDYLLSRKEYRQFPQFQRSLKSFKDKISNDDYVAFGLRKTSQIWWL
jgi:hypothetical protein